METTPLSFFLTGATTFVGRAVTRYLVAQGHRVTGMTYGSDGANQVRADGGLPVFADPQRAGEIKSMLRMAQADVLVNLAPQAANQLPQYSSEWREPWFTDQVTALSEAAQAAGVKFVVQTSFAFLYGDTHGEWVDESAPLHAPGGEQVFKAAIKAEQTALNASVPACVLRTGFLYGALSEGLTRIAADLRMARAVITGSHHHYANWTHADDLAAAVALVAQKQLVGAVLNVVDDTPETSGAFLDYLAESLGLPHPSPSGRPFMRPTPTSHQIALLGTSVRAKNASAKETLGWQPQFPSYREGIHQTLLNWRAAEKVSP